MAFTGFGVGVLDLEPDGAPGLAIANGRVRLGDPVGTLLEAPWSGLAEPDSLLRNAGDASWTWRTGPWARPASAEGSRSATWMATSFPTSSAPTCSPRPDPAGGPTDHSRGVLVDVRERSGAVALGARVTLESRSEQTRTIRANSGYCAPATRAFSSPLSRRPRGSGPLVGRSPETFGPLTLGQLHTLRRGEGTPDGPLPRSSSTLPWRPPPVLLSSCGRPRRLRTSRSSRGGIWRLGDPHTP